MTVRIVAKHCALVIVKIPAKERVILVVIPLVLENVTEVVTLFVLILAQVVA